MEPGFRIWHLTSLGYKEESCGCFELMLVDVFLSIDTFKAWYILMTHVYWTLNHLSRKVSHNDRTGIPRYISIIMSCIRQESGVGTFKMVVNLIEKLIIIFLEAAIGKL